MGSEMCIRDSLVLYDRVRAGTISYLQALLHAVRSRTPWDTVAQKLTLENRTMYGVLLHSSYARSTLLYVHVHHGIMLYDRVRGNRTSGKVVLLYFIVPTCRNVYALTCMVWHCGSHSCAVHCSTHTILELPISFVSVCHGPVYYGDNCRYCMILLPSASRIVCCGFYGVPSKLLEKVLLQSCV